jgi:hypothetical protein
VLTVLLLTVGEKVGIWVGAALTGDIGAEVDGDIVGWKVVIVVERCYQNSFTSVRCS